VGKIADAVRGFPLPEQNKQKLLALDREFVEMESKIQALKTENLNLQAQVKPLEREVQGLKDSIEQHAATGHIKLDDMSEKILIAIANCDALQREAHVQELGLTVAKGNHYYDILVEKGFIRVHYDDWYSATPEGRKYLARRDLL